MRNPRTVALAVLLAAIGFGQEAGPILPFEGDPQPAYRDGVAAPGANLEGEPEAPEAGQLERDGSVSDRFEAEGQKVEYRFGARAGELSLFDLTTLSYERGAQATSVMRVLDEKGQELARSRQSGGEAFNDFLAFVAPEDGDYRLRLRAQRGFFRYALVRHSGFRPHVAQARYEIGARERLFDYLTGSGDTLRYRLELASGQELSVRALNLGEPARIVARAARRSALEAGSSGGMMGMGGMGAMGGGRGARRTAEPDEGRMKKGGRSGGRGRAGRGGMRAGEGASAGPRSQVPRLQVSLWKEGRRMARAPSDAAHFLRVPIEEAGVYEVHVEAAGGAEGLDEGGIFELELARDVPVVAIAGSVADGEGAGMGGMVLRFLREPELDATALVRTAEDGAWQAELPPGEYFVMVMPRGPGDVHRLRTVIDGSRELHLIYDPPRR